MFHVFTSERAQLLTFCFQLLAYCKNVKQEKWYKFDDHTVTEMDGSDVRSTAAYILFYTINEPERRSY